jgi:hypothetical protein
MHSYLHKKIYPCKKWVLQQQDPEEEDDDLVTGKQFKEMMHMM